MYMVPVDERVSVTARDRQDNKPFYSFKRQYSENGTRYVHSYYY